EVDDAEVRTARRHADFSELAQLLFQPRALRGVAEVQQIARVAVIRRRLAEIIEAGPDEFAGDKRVTVLRREFDVGRTTPARRVEIVRTHLKIRAALRFV